MGKSLTSTLYNFQEVPSGVVVQEHRIWRVQCSGLEVEGSAV